MTTEATERDLVELVEELLANFPVIKDAAYNVEHALFADAIERQRNSPFWGESKKIARLYAESPELLRRLVEEVKGLREIREHLDTELIDIRECGKCDLCEDHNE